MIDLGQLQGSIVINGIQQAQKDLKSISSSAHEMQNNLKSISDTLSSTGSTLTKSLTVPVAGVGTAISKMTIDFEAQMSKVKAISSATGEEMELLEAKAKEMGAQTKFSALESAQAYEYMAMAGWKTEDMLSGIEGIMSLAAASGEDLALTSDIVTDALTGFGLSAKDSGHFADILATASSNANTNVAMMGETFKYCSPIAGSLGFSAEETAEAIGLMGNAGIKASMAGTSLRQIMTAMAGDIEISGDAIGDYVVETQNADGTMRGLNEILDDCRVAFSQLSESEQAAAAESIAGKTAMSGFLALMNAGSSDIDKLRGSIENCDGSAKAMAETMQDNLAGRIELLKGSLEDLGLKIGEMIMPTLESIVAKLNEWVDAFAGLDTETQKSIITMAGYAAAIGPVLLIGGKLVGIMSSLCGAVSAVSGFFATGTMGVTGFGFALSGLLSPIGLVVAALATLGLAKHTLSELSEQQRMWNEQVEESVRLANDLTVATADQKANLEEQIESIDTLLNTYSETNNAMDAYVAKNGDVAGAYRDLSGLSDEQIEALEKEAVQYDKNAEEMQKAKNALENQYGTIEDAIKIRNNYEQRLKNSAEAEKLLTKCVSEADKALAQEALTEKTTANNCKTLVEQKKALEKQDKLNATQQKNLDKINKQLIETLGDSVVAYNNQGEVVGANIDLCNKEIIAIEATANAKLGQVNTINISSAHIQQASKEECERIIEYCKQEIAALEARQIALEGSSESAELEAERVRMNKAMSEAKARLEELVVPAINASNSIGDVGKAGTVAGKGVSSGADEAKEALEKVKDTVSELTEDIKHMDEEQLNSNKEKLQQIAEQNQGNKDIINEIKSSMTDFAEEELRRELESYENNDNAKYEDLMTTLEDMKTEYSGYADAVDLIEEAITEQTEEEYNKRVEALEKAHDDMLSAIDEFYDEKNRILTEEEQAEVDALQAEIDAIEEAQKEKERIEREAKLKQAIQDAEDEKERKKAEEEYDKWLSEQKIARLKEEQKAIKDKNDLIRAGLEEEKALLVENAEYQKQVQEEMLAIKKQNQELSDEEIRAIAEENIQKRNEQELEETNRMLDDLLAMAPEYRQMGENMAKAYLEGLKAHEGDIKSFWESTKDAEQEVDGSHRTGLNTVPFDGYKAELHKGEMVLTQAEANRYRNQQTQPTIITNQTDTSKLESLMEKTLKAIDRLPKNMKIENNMA